MGKKYLIDTNVIIDFCAFKIPELYQDTVAEIIDNSPNISIINFLELKSAKSLNREIDLFTNYANTIKLEAEIINKTIELRRKYKIKLPDAIIAATAIVYNLTLLTHNYKDFIGLKNLKIIDSWSFEKY